jgi:hypothetical protein
MTHANSKRKYQKTIAGMLAMALILKPSAVLGGSHRVAAHRRTCVVVASAPNHSNPTLFPILPPPDEEPPPPPPFEPPPLLPPGEAPSNESNFDQTVANDSTAHLRKPRNSDRLEAESDHGQRVLVLPRVYSFRSVLYLKANSLRAADSAGYYDELHR